MSVARCISIVLWTYIKEACDLFVRVPLGNQPRNTLFPIIECNSFRRDEGLEQGRGHLACEEGLMCYESLDRIYELRKRKPTPAWIRRSRESRW